MDQVALVGAQQNASPTQVNHTGKHFLCGRCKSELKKMNSTKPQWLDYCANVWAATATFVDIQLNS